MNLVPNVFLAVEPHPSLILAAFSTHFGDGIAAPSPNQLTDLLHRDAAAPVTRSEQLRSAVRDMLRHGGYKPTGRGKPASEYLLRAAEDGSLRSINLAVDTCNAVSLHSGLPISVIDLGRASPPFRIAIARQGTRYVFNPAGQEIDVGGLVCLFDANGACGNAVKDAQRTKTNADTHDTLSVIWGCKGFESELASAFNWYQDLLAGVGASTSRITPSS